MNSVRTKTRLSVLCRYNMNNMNNMNIPSPNDMDFDSDGIVPELPAAFNQNNNNKAFGNKFNHNYSPIITNSHSHSTDNN